MQLKQTFKSLRNWVKISILLIPTLILILLFSSNTTKNKMSEVEKQLVKELSVPDSITDSTNDTILFLLNFEHIPDSKVKHFVDRFLNTAIVEKHKFNIPIAIKLAQGIVESNLGQSRLAIKANNHFGHKCLSRCKSCDGKSWKIVNNCINVKDDGRDDLFRMFPSAWHSWREHSKLLNGTRYKHLQKLPATNYKGWAKGLKKAGYATHGKYAEVLINRIETHKLNHFDEVDIYELAKSRGIDLKKIK